jgi:GT2 family glycosyltransferase
VPKSHKLSIVIVNYKTPALVLNCLNSFSSEINHDTHITIVDNASNDDSGKIIQNWILKHNLSNRISLILSPDNSGFSGGNNTGIKHIRADYYLLLNSDTIVRNGAIKNLVSCFEKNTNLGVLGPRLEWPDGTPQESCFRFHTPISEFIGSAKTGLITKCLQNYVVPQPVSESCKSYDWVSFACVMISAEVFDQIGLMDDQYFMYYEDVEFCRRTKKAGWEIMYEPSAHVVHLRGGSSPVKSQAKLRKRLPRYFYESRARYFFQHYGRAGLFFANVLWTLGWLISSVRSLLSKSYQSDCSEKQWLDIWTNFFNPEKPYLHPEKYGKKA